ncbi:MAG: pyruvate kinase [Candidatus Nanohaloarchaea archaeon]|nr:pyruvate kinase [Candidatus Nanohaloarchaea archaeon]
MGWTGTVNNPAPQPDCMLAALADEGMNVARQNFSHGTHDEHRQILQQVRDLDQPVATMIDTQGPEVRLQEVEEGTALEAGSDITIVGDDITGDATAVGVDHPQLIDSLEAGDTVLIDDGELELEVRTVDKDRATCVVVYGGELGSNKSVNVPGKDVGLEAPTEKDREDIAFGAEQGFDFVSASFVKKADDIHAIQGIIDDHDSNMNIIAKIEHIKAVENLDEIIEAADGIMVARGDLGVEMDASEVPILQKKIIKKANRLGKPVIVATQMLKSMTDSPRATRAEVSDIANAVIDGTDAVMLSEETAAGDYPVKSLDFMDDVVRKMEDSYEGEIHHTVKTKSKNVAEIICKNVWQASREADISTIVAHTSSGYTARNIAKYRPETDIVAFTDSEMVQHQLQLTWGVQAYYREFPEQVDEMICDSAQDLYDRELVEKDDLLVLSAGVPTSISGTTNMLEIRKVSSLLEEKEKIQQRQDG